MGGSFAEARGWRRAQGEGRCWSGRAVSARWEEEAVVTNCTAWGPQLIMCMFQKCWNTRFLMFSSLKKDKLTKWWLCELFWSVFPMTHICGSKCHIVSFQISTITIYQLKRNILTKNKTPSKGKRKVIAVLSFPSRWQRQEFLSFYTYLPSIHATFLLMT